MNQRRITAGVEKAAKALSADVVRILYDLDSDWVGHPAVFFKIILTDKSSRPEHLREVTERVTLKIMKETKPD